MASRDKSQGFGFVYVDLKQLMNQRDELAKNPLHPQGQTAQVVNLNRDAKRVTDGAAVETKKPELKFPASGATLEQIRENLDRLQSLHHKLHAVLDELNKTTDGGKKKN